MKFSNEEIWQISSASDKQRMKLIGENKYYVGSIRSSSTATNEYGIIPQTERFSMSLYLPYRQFREYKHFYAYQLELLEPINFLDE